jgi:hypothetical protein
MVHADVVPVPSPSPKVTDAGVVLVSVTSTSPVCDTLNVLVSLLLTFTVPLNVVVVTGGAVVVLVGALLL